MNDRFKTRVLNNVITYAKPYQALYVNHSYLIASDAFTSFPYYEIEAHEDNYLHLTGLATSLSAYAFFQKCLAGTICEEDFSYNGIKNNPQNAKGTVRRKIVSLAELCNLLSGTSFVQENFHKNRIDCSFAISNSEATLGFAIPPKLIPNTLLKGNQLQRNQSRPISVLLSKRRSDKLYDTVLVGSEKELHHILPVAQHLIAPAIIKGKNQ